MEKREYDVSTRSQITIRSSMDFLVWTQNEDGLLALVGPDSTTQRKFVFDVSKGVEKVIIETNGEVFIDEKARPDPLEAVDPLPMEGYLERPLTLKEEMMRFIATEIHRQQLVHNDELEEFDDAMDFDVDDDQPLPYSKYEEMVDEYPPEEEAQEVSPKEEKNSSVADQKEEKEEAATG